MAGRGPQRMLSPEQAQALADAYVAGESINSIATRTGVARTSVQRTLKRSGVTTRADDLRPTIPEERRAEILQECREGMTIKDAAETFDVSMSTVMRIVRESGQFLGPRERHKGYTLRDDAFDIITPASAYWAGFVFIDGSIQRDKYGSPFLSINLGEEDRKQVEKLRTFLGSNHAIIDQAPHTSLSRGELVNSGPTVYFKVRSKKLVSRLFTLGMAWHKPERDPVPELVASRDFWRGALDADGSSWERSRDDMAHFSLCGHMPLLTKFQAVLRENGLADLQIGPTSSGGAFRLGTGGSHALATLKFFYGNVSAEIALGRKLVLVREILRRNGQVDLS